MQIPQAVLTAIKQLNQNGYEAYLVGGCVRDHVLHIPPHDFDLCTSATPPEMQKVFSAFRTIETGLKHGTLTVLIDNEPLEITTFRLDGEYLDNRHPKEVIFTRTLENDLSRRDFTINAMAYHPEKGLTDLFCGREDCEHKIIRCVGDAATRFEEDALRILRALRFAGRLEFTVEAETKQAIFRQKELLHRISAERIASELSGLLVASGAQKMLSEFAPVLFTVLPQLDTPDYAFSLEVLSRSDKALPLRFAALLFPLGAEMAKSTLQQLKLPNHLQDTVSALIAFRHLEITEENMLHALMQTGDTLLFPLLTFQNALAAAKAPECATACAEKEQSLAAKAHRLIRSGACYTLAALAVKGSDLAQIGFSGPAIGQALHFLLEEVTLGKIPNEKEALLALSQKINA